MCSKQSEDEEINEQHLEASSDYLTMKPIHRAKPFRSDADAQAFVGVVVDDDVDELPKDESKL